MERSEVCGTQGSGELYDCGRRGVHLRSCRGGGGLDQLRPGGDSLDDGDQGEDLERLERGAVDASLFQQLRRIEEAMEVVDQACGKQRTHLLCTLLLGVDPVTIRRWLESQNPRASDRRKGFGCYRFPQARPFERRCAGCGEGLRNLRDEIGGRHVYYRNRARNRLPAVCVGIEVDDQKGL